MQRVTSRATMLAAFLSGLAALLACSGAQTQDVLATQMGTSTSGGASTSSSGTGTSGTGTSGTGTSGTGTSGDPGGTSNGDPAGCQEEAEDNDGPGTANELKVNHSVCGTLLLDGDRADWLRFEMPLAARTFSIEYTGDIRIQLTPPGDGAVPFEFRADREVELKPGTWLVQVRPNSGSGGKSDGLEWRLTISAN